MTYVLIAIAVLVDLTLILRVMADYMMPTGPKYSKLQAILLLPFFWQGLAIMWVITVIGKLRRRR